MTFSAQTIISAMGAVIVFLGGYWIKSLDKNVEAIKTDLRDGFGRMEAEATRKFDKLDAAFNADHEILRQLQFKDTFLNGRIAAAPVEDVKPVSQAAEDIAAMAEPKQ